jgi:hypothetical protein
VFTPEDVYSHRHWQKRTKWNKRQPNIREGDIVIMKEQSPRNQWPLGRVVEAILSEDGKVRKAKIAISRDREKKVYYRPINELVPIMHA